MDQTSQRRTEFRRAPNQRGGPEWKGPRERLVTRTDPTSAAMIRIRAKAAGLSTSEWLEAIARKALRT
jgi:hypothetical protein